MSTHYNKNKPLFNSIITGLFYLLFSWSIDFFELMKISFVSLMIFLPGLTFPITTCYYKMDLYEYSGLQQIIHLVLSVGIYFGAIWIHGEGRIEYLTIVAGFSGSLFFLLETKFLLQKNITFPQIVITAILSGLAFLPYEIIGRNGFLLGLTIFLWTIINGFLLNYEYQQIKSTV